MIWVVLVNIRNDSVRGRYGGEHRLIEINQHVLILDMWKGWAKND